MYEIIKSVINANGYNLTDILSKIDAMWIGGKLTDTQREELRTLAQNGATAQNEVDLLAKVQELERRVAALENAGTTEPTEPTVEPYQPGKWYYGGMKCLFEGDIYVCTAPKGVVCVWSPADYPTYWTREE